ncbi:MAG: multicopper oxidase domain-containing protein [Desulfobulbaceae bacterium]
MQTRVIRRALQVTVLGGVFMVLQAVNAGAMIQGITGTSFNLTATTGHISTPDSGSYLIWGYANGAGLAQYPGPTIIVNEGDQVQVKLTNSLTVAGAGPAPNVSIVFPGQHVVVSPTDSGIPGILANEAAPGGTVTYQFTAAKPGTYTYYSGTDSALQVEMGLIGAMIVRPASGANYAYNHPDTQFDRETLFLLSEMDPRIHQVVETFGPDAVAATGYLANYFPVLWFINGRAAPDTMADNGVPWLPNQPYNCMPMMNPGDRLLMRVIGGGRDMHPFHFHGNHARVIARDGRLLESTLGAGPDLSYELFTIQSQPGSTVDAIFGWTGQGLGWDIYGSPAEGPEYAHECMDMDNDDFDDMTHEYCPDHYKPFPVTLPGSLELTFGGFYSGSPFLGLVQSLPPGEGGMNPNGGYTYMWHSHTEKEMVNYDIFPGGMMTMLIIEAPGVMIH